MKSVLPTVLGIPAGGLSRLVGIPSWLVIVVVAASLVLGLVKAVIPQESADRLHLLLALRGCRARPEISSGITVAGQVMNDEDQDSPRSTTKGRSAARTGRRTNSARSRNERGLGAGHSDGTD